MKKIIFSLILSMMILFVLWTSIAYYNYGSDIIHHHLNLEGMFIRIKNAWVSYSVYDFISDFVKSFNDLEMFSLVAEVEKIASALNWNINFNNNDILKMFVRIAEVFINPIYGIFVCLYVPLEMIVPIIRIVVTCMSILLECLGFVFNPMFI